MKTIRKTVRAATTPRVDVNAFAEQHDLTMQITFYEEQGIYHASFEGCEVVEGDNGGIFASLFGVGSTEREAIDNYLPKVSEQTVRVYYRGIGPQQFSVPILY